MKRTSWKAVSVVAAVAVVSAAAYLTYRWSAAPHPNTVLAAENEGNASGPTAVDARVVPVVITPVEMRPFEDAIVVQGNLQAKQTSTVSARIPGTIMEVYVDEGDKVVAGETKLFMSDSLKPQKAVEISRQDLAVARCGLREKEANLERVQADFRKAELDLDRFKRLREEQAVSLDLMEQQQSRYDQTKAMLKHAHTLVDLGGEQVRQAETALEIAEKDLRDTLVYAPITGTVSMRFKDPGEMGGAGDAVVRIEDPAVLEVSAFLPDRAYSRVVVGETPLRLSVYGVDAGEYVLSYKAPTINLQLRTFEIKALIENPKEGVVPGALADIAVLLSRRESPGVPTNAIQIRDGRKVVFTVQGDTAGMVEVETGIEGDGWTEVLNGSLPEGTPVVTMGHFMLNEGSRISVTERDANASEAPQGEPTS